MSRFLIIPSEDAINNAIKMAKEKERQGFISWFGGDFKKAVIGFTGQSMFMEIMGIKYPEWSSKGDDGIDLEIRNKKIDIKTEGRICYIKPEYRHNVCYPQSDIKNNYYQNNYYLFINYNTSTWMLEICGFISKDEFIDYSDIFEKGALSPERKDGWCYEYDTRAIFHEKIWKFPSLECLSLWLEVSIERCKKFIIN